MLSDKDFEIKFFSLRTFIKNSVPVFDDDSAEAKEARLNRAATDKIFFVKTYLPHYASKAFADVHRELFELADTVNTPVIIAGARAIAKTTIISFFDEMHKSLFEKNKFTVFVCDTKDTASLEYILPIMAELEENPRILSDFGDLKTKVWDKSNIVLSNGKRILGISIRMKIRGKKHRISRLDRIILEDIEDENSPKKKTILKKRIKWITGSLMKATNLTGWQFIYLGNYFSKKTIFHSFLTEEKYKHWIRKIYHALIEAKGKEQSIWEDGLPLETLLRERLEDPVTFRTERMQKPDDEEAIFKEEWIQYYDLKDIMHLNLPIYPVISYKDPSALKGEEHCFKAIIFLAVDKASAIYYVLYAWIKKTSVLKGVRTHIDLSRDYRSCFDGVESNGYQAAEKEIYEMIEQEIGVRLNLKLINNRLPKEVRIGSLSSPIERGYMKFLKDQSDQRELIEQLLDFPDGEFVDGPDALAGAKEVADTYILRKKNKVRAGILGDYE